eukprot:COSAG01_NODE_2642_length_7323_cov_13.197121_5_plen_134_part_00
MFIIILALYLAVGVAFGAVGAHVLAGKISEAAFRAFQTAVDYHQLYTLFCLILAILKKTLQDPKLFLDKLIPNWLLNSFFVALLIFSGSIYLYVFTGVKLWIKLTPVGGFLLIISCLTLSGLALRLLIKSAKR